MRVLGYSLKQAEGCRWGGKHHKRSKSKFFGKKLPIFAFSRNSAEKVYEKRYENRHENGHENRHEKWPPT